MQPQLKDLLVPPAITAPSVSPPPPSERPVVTAGNWAGSEQRPESCSHPRAQRPASPLCSPRLRRGSVSWLLSRVFLALTGRVTLCVWPRACMLDVVINALPLPPPPTTLRQVVPKAGRNNWRDLERFWRTAVCDRGWWSPLNLKPCTPPPPIPREHHCTGPTGGTAGVFFLFFFGFVFFSFFPLQTLCATGSAR